MEEISTEKLKEVFSAAREWAMFKAAASANAGEQIFFNGMAIQADIFLKSVSGLEEEKEETNIEDIMKNIGWN